VFGSVARNEPWPRGMPIRSDLDLLVITRDPVQPGVVDELLDATLPLFLECGRQIGPQFRTREQLAARDERTVTFGENVERDGVVVYPGAG
jgi:predicted nucleotidyltransferase